MLTIKFRKSFLIELSKLPPDVKTEIEELVFEKLVKQDNPGINKIEKMKGYPGKYQIRMGNLRFGFSFDKGKKEVLCENIVHRKDLYKIFYNNYYE